MLLVLHAVSSVSIKMKRAHFSHLAGDGNEYIYVVVAVVVSIVNYNEYRFNAFDHLNSAGITNPLSGRFSASLLRMFRFEQFQEFEIK